MDVSKNGRPPISKLRHGVEAVMGETSSVGLVVGTLVRVFAAISVIGLYRREHRHAQVLKNLGSSH
jgi:hypothetical protein